MKRHYVTGLFVSLFLSTALAGGNKLFETKLSADPVLASATSNSVMVFAGDKDLNVLQLSDGKLVLDKSYKDYGVKVTKATDAVIHEGKVVICNEKSVCCIDIVSGVKLWENSSFIELDAGTRDALTICGNNVLVSDKKSKGNFVLSCLNLTDGKQNWILENEKNKILPKYTYCMDKFQSIGIYTEEKKNSQFRILDLATGKVMSAQPMEGTPIYSFSDISSGNLFVHHLINENQSWVSAFNLKDEKPLWKAKASNKSPNTPWVMNTSILTYYATMDAFDDKVMLNTEGIEVFDAKSGKSLYNLPYVPYYKWGVGHYVNGIFQPIVTEKGILVPDRSTGDLYLKMYDKNTGRLLWTTDKLKKKDSAPVAVVNGNNVVVQFGGLNYFEVLNNGGIGKLLDPFTVCGFDLETGKLKWNFESKQDFYHISKTNDQVIVMGKKTLDVINPQDGKLVKSDKNPFGEDYFMTKFTIGSFHKIQKSVTFDYDARILYHADGKKMIKYSF